VVIRSYTRESGVRNLEREIAAICRAVAKDVAQGKTEKQIHYCRQHPYLPRSHQVLLRGGGTHQIFRVATGLAWTPTGGDYSSSKSTKMRGKGALSLTGQLGDVMKESAQAALSYIRSKYGDYEIPRFL
jgi:ATP-dependent Lon protease